MDKKRGLKALDFQPVPKRPALPGAAPSRGDTSFSGPYDPPQGTHMAGDAYRAPHSGSRPIVALSTFPAPSDLGSEAAGLPSQQANRGDSGADSRQPGLSTSGPGRTATARVPAGPRQQKAPLTLTGPRPSSSSALPPSSQQGPARMGASSGTSAPVQRAPLSQTRVGGPPSRPLLQQQPAARGGPAPAPAPRPAYVPQYQPGVSPQDAARTHVGQPASAPPTAVPSPTEKRVTAGSPSANVPPAPAAVGAGPRPSPTARAPAPIPPSTAEQQHQPQQSSMHTPAREAPPRAALPSYPSYRPGVLPSTVARQSGMGGSAVQSSSPAGKSSFAMQQAPPSSQRPAVPLTAHIKPGTPSSSQPVTPEVAVPQEQRLGSGVARTSPPASLEAAALQQEVARLRAAVAELEQGRNKAQEEARTLHEAVEQRDADVFLMKLSLATEEAERGKLLKDIEGLQKQISFKEHELQLADRRRQMAEQEVLVQRKRKSPGVSSVTEPEDDDDALSRQSSCSPDGKKARPIAGGSPPKASAAQAPPVASTPAAPTTTSATSDPPGSALPGPGHPHDLLGALREFSDDFCCLLASSAPSPLGTAPTAAQPSAGNDSFLLRLAATLRPGPTGGSGGAPVACSGVAGEDVVRRHELLRASLASQLYQTVLLAGTGTGSPVAVLTCLARYLRAPEVMGRTRLLAAARVMQCLLSISAECREYATTAVFPADGQSAAAVPAEAFESRCKGLLLPPVKSGREEQADGADVGALAALPQDDLPGGGLSGLLSTLLTRLVKELETSADPETAATVHELLGILLTLAHETPPGDGPCGFWDGLLEDGALQEVLVRALRARQVGVVGVGVEVLQCLVQHQGLFHRLRMLRHGAFFSDISQQILQWHVDHRWDERARPAVDRLSLRVLRLLIGMVVKYGVAGRELIWSTGGQQQQQQRDASTSAVHLIPSLIHVLNHEVMLLMASKPPDDRSGGRALHLTLAREAFELLTLVGLQQRDRSDALKDLIARSNVKWTLAALNFRLMNNMVDPSLSDLGEAAECWAETLEG